MARTVTRNESRMPLYRCLLVRLLQGARARQPARAGRVGYYHDRRIQNAVTDYEECRVSACVSVVRSIRTRSASTPLRRVQSRHRFASGTGMYDANARPLSSGVVGAYIVDLQECKDAQLGGGKSRVSVGRAYQ